MGIVHTLAWGTLPPHLPLAYRSWAKGGRSRHSPDNCGVRWKWAEATWGPDCPHASSPQLHPTPQLSGSSHAFLYLNPQPFVQVACLPHPPTPEIFSPSKNLLGPSGLHRWVTYCLFLLTFQSFIVAQLGKGLLGALWRRAYRAVGMTGTWGSPCTAIKHYVTLQVPKLLRASISPSAGLGDKP